MSERRRPVTDLDDLSHKLLLGLISAARELDTKGVTDRSRNDVFGPVTADAGPTTAAAADSAVDPKGLLLALRGGFSRVGQEAERNGADGAASELTSVYMTEFEPLERYLLGRSPQSVRPLEVEFNSLRGDLFAGLKGIELTRRLDRISDEVESLIARLEARPTGTFGTAFFESLITIVREGVEVILVLAMLIALVAKAAPTVTKSETDAMQEDRARARAMGAIWWGVGTGRYRQPGDGGGLERSRLLDAGQGTRDPRRAGDARRRGRALLRQLLADLAGREPSGGWTSSRSRLGAGWCGADAGP